MDPLIAELKQRFQTKIHLAPLRPSAPLTEGPPVCALCFERRTNEIYWRLFHCRTCLWPQWYCATCADSTHENTCGYCAGPVTWVPRGKQPIQPTILPPVVLCSEPIIVPQPPQPVENVSKKGWLF